MMGIFFNQGQVCCAGSRLFVEESVKDEFLEKLKEKSAKIVVGDPMDKATHMGPQVSEEQLNRIKGYVDIARCEGATVLAGGESPTTRRRLSKWLLLPADDLFRREEPDARGPGRDFWSGGFGDHVSRTKTI